ncbi:YihY/virulence factor BrkB family protein [Deminuibacter soli]|uniref:YihY/virulence factor BrkB family protein n=1 Tax=Deminuibacter soli TaxID=2291815 RepID=A0A3E1NNM9_9BACT|nr:YihY/virulence factor BrkB family protein [Deminuibacter soli]RFM29532.1 YihY/virulence factor BrkB family protein [Deminuibacter soli]
MKLISFKDSRRLLNDALQLLLKNDPLRLAGATSFFSTFALPPILLILIQLMGLMFNRREMGRNLVQRLSSVVGQDSVQPIINAIRGFRGLAQSWPVAIFGSLFMLFVATTLFKIIKSSFNQLWMIRMAAGKENIRSVLFSRLRSLLVIVVAGVLFLASLLIESMQTLLGNYLSESWPGIASVFNVAFTQLLSLLVVTAWFTVLFRYLPDGRPTWRIALTGAFITSILFNTGKVVLHVALPGSNLGVLYGTSTSVVLLLLFVFYSSIILYFGAAFTKVYSDYMKKPIQPLTNALYYTMSDVAG